MILFAVKKNKFYNRLIPAEGSGGNSGFTSEKCSGKKASGIL